MVGFLQLFPPAYMEDEEMSLGHALVGDHDEEIVMVAFVKTTCMQVPPIGEEIINASSLKGRKF